MDIYLFGDIGGHFLPFMWALEEIGVNTETGEIPEGTAIVQVGDLVHRGPMSNELVEWVDNAITANPGRWVQLFGNHEGHHIGGPKFGQKHGSQFLEWDLSPSSEKILKKWWSSKKAYMAAAIRRTDTEDDREMLVTHAGLCFQAWAGLGFPSGARSTALTLNSQNVHLAFAPGWMLGGYYKSSTGSMQPPGVAWASPAKEVYPSLIDRTMGFDQVHGHATLWNWFTEDWYCDSDISLNIDRWDAKRFTRWTNKAGDKHYCIDQGLGKNEPRFGLRALHVVGEILEP